LQDGTKTEGVLVSCNDKEIKLETTTRENKAIGKGKIDVIKQELILFEKVKESKIKLKY
jgi:ribosome maturation factor RimP